MRHKLFQTVNIESIVIVSLLTERVTYTPMESEGDLKPWSTGKIPSPKGVQYFVL